ncbi:hypothetical protein ACJJTC_002553 [Scirpophaga incertulas]
MHFIILSSILSAVTAMPSYIAVPADQIAFVDLSSLHVRRVPRQALAPPPLPNLYSQDYQPVPIHLHQYPQDPVGLIPPIEQEAPARLVRLQQPQEDLSGPADLGSAPLPERENLVSQPQAPERPPDFGEFVDFGGHTGDNGAFGWYADYPVNTPHEHHDHDHSHYKK